MWRKAFCAVRFPKLSLWSAIKDIFDVPCIPPSLSLGFFIRLMYVLHPPHKSSPACKKVDSWTHLAINFFFVLPAVLANHAAGGHLQCRRRLSADPILHGRTKTTETNEKRAPCPPPPFRLFDLPTGMRTMTGHKQTQ